MAPDDAQLALERHATSKIRTSGDLAAIATLGFRGEALPSIASVSHLTLRTRARGAMSGTEIEVTRRRDRRRSPRPGAPEGTRIDVEDLFYNLPARRKFLKSDQAESAQVSRIVTQLALGAHGVGFSLVSAGRRLLECPPAGSRRERLFQIYGDPGRPDRGLQGDGRHPRRRVHRAAGRDRAAPRAAERLHQRPAGARQDHRARHRRRLQRGVDQGTQSRSAPVHRDAARCARRQRAPDQGRSALPRAVADARGDSPRGRRRARPGPRADAVAHARPRRRRRIRRGRRCRSRACWPAAVPEPVEAGSGLGPRGRRRHSARRTRHSGSFGMPAPSTWHRHRTKHRHAALSTR